jgi:hypothetical protein
VTQTQHGLIQQLRQLEAQAQPQVDVAALAQGLEAFCQRLQSTLDDLTFAQRRQLVELLIDRVIVTHDQVEIRYVVPTGPKGETTPFCHVRLDYLDRPTPAIHSNDLPGTHLGQIGHQNFRLFRPIAAPFITQDNGDISNMAKGRPVLYRSSTCGGGWTHRGVPSTGDNASLADG